MRGNIKMVTIVTSLSVFNYELPAITRVDRELATNGFGSIIYLHLASGVAAYFYVADYKQFKKHYLKLQQSKRYIQLKITAGNCVLHKNKEFSRHRKERYDG